MKNLLFILFLIIVGRVYSQGTSTDDFKPYFSAVVVKNLDSSMLWYQSVFGLKIKNRMNDSSTGFKLAILESNGFLIELIENKTSLAKETIIADKPDNTLVQGFFKIGFKVPHIEKWIKQFRSLKIDVGHIWSDHTTGKKNFIIKDPDGNLIQFYD